MIRVATEKDLPGILALFKQLQPADPVLTESRAKAAFRGIMSRSAFRVLGDVEGDKVVAACYINIIPNLTRNASPYAFIENVVVDEALRRPGRGKALMQFALDYAWQAGCYKVVLETGRPHTHPFYEACGFHSGEKTAFTARRSVHR